MKLKLKEPEAIWKCFLPVMTIITLFTGSVVCVKNAKAETATTIFKNTSNVIVDKEFAEEDREVRYNKRTATYITLSGRKISVKKGCDAATYTDVLTICEEGTYVVRGNLTDGQIIVTAEKKDKVRLILDGISIHCSNNAPILIKSAEKVIITLKEGTVNTLTDGPEYKQTDNWKVDGVIFSKSDLSINGYGILNITGNYRNGIVSKKSLVFTGGSFHITAAHNTVHGFNGVKIKDGTFDLSATEGDAIKSKNAEDPTKGFVYIAGGNINVKTCNEGIEGTNILIDNGSIDITAQDDGLNAASDKKETSETPATSEKKELPDPISKGPGGMPENPFEIDPNSYIFISGGKIKIDSLGDGIDSNGHLYISGGDICVSGPTKNWEGGLDYNGDGVITSGTIVVAGSLGMAQGFIDPSTQCSILYNLTSVCEAGTKAILTDQNGKVVFSYAPNKPYQSILISTPSLKKNKFYRLTCGNQTAGFPLNSVVSSNAPRMPPIFPGGPGGPDGPGGQKAQDGKVINEGK